ncbi:MAG: sortase [bacterium]|nr:sortase [bacterium]
MRKTISICLIALGVIIVASVVGPIGWHQLRYNLKPKLIDPTEVSGNPAVLAAGILDSQYDDFTDSSTWFPTAPTRSGVASKVRYYNLSIPALNVNNVSVEINGTDLKKNPIQYAGTATPGDYGNTVIFGHSTLPQLYKPGDPVSIFNPLLKIKKGDEIVINYDGITFRYVVRETTEVHPDQIEVLAQRYDKHELTLITCVPLGTYLRRFVARAELVN